MKLITSDIFFMQCIQSNFNILVSLEWCVKDWSIKHAKLCTKSKISQVPKSLDVRQCTRKSLIDGNDCKLRALKHEIWLVL